MAYGLGREPGRAEVMSATFILKGWTVTIVVILAAIARLRHCTTKATRDNLLENGRGFEPRRWDLWKRKFEYHNIFMCHRIFLFWCFSLLICGLLQKQESWIWSEGRHLPAPRRAQFPPGLASGLALGILQLSQAAVP